MKRIYKSRSDFLRNSVRDIKQVAIMTAKRVTLDFSGSKEVLERSIMRSLRPRRWHKRPSEGNLISLQ
jgi:Arc/MetJ-type ribon-helix-helix transcriptional regulator